MVQTNPRPFGSNAQECEGCGHLRENRDTRLRQNVCVGRTGSAVMLESVVQTSSDAGRKGAMCTESEITLLFILIFTKH